MTAHPTYPQLRALGRRPSEYEIASSQLAYHLGRDCAVRTPAADWYAAQRAACALRVHDWERFRDPRATTHAKYLELQRARDARADALLASIEATDYGARLSYPWLGVLDRVFAPLRFPVHGLQMLAAYLGAAAPCGRLVVTGLLQAADETRRIERLAHRLGQLQQTNRECGLASRTTWEREPGWQPMRALIERLLAVHDWGEAFVAVNAVLKPAFDELFMIDFARLAGAAGDGVLEQLLLVLHEDCAWHGQWSSALTAMLVHEDAANARAMATWVERWKPWAEAAVASLLALIDELLADAVGLARKDGP